MSEIEEGGASRPDEEEESGAETEVAAKRGSPPIIKLAILVVGVLIVTGGAFFLAKLVILPMLQEPGTPVAEKMAEVAQKVKTEKAETKKKEKKKKKKKKGPVIRHDISNISVNTAGSLGRRYATFNLTIETTSKKTQEELADKDSQVRDALIAYFGGRTVQELTNSTFLMAAKDTVIKILNSILTEEPVDTVYFTSFLIQ